MKSFVIGKKRAVSEIIGTLMILVITVVGAVFISNALSDGFFSIDQTPNPSRGQIDPLRLIGYDTRDSTKLKDITTLDNDFNQQLCAGDCVANQNEIPANSGTEFVVLHLHNTGINSVFLHNILIRNVGHTWNIQNNETPLDASITGVAGTTYPLAGTFSIISVNDPNMNLKTTNEIRSDEEVLVVIKLSPQIPQHIEMWDALRILVNFGGSQPAEFVVLSGDAKW
jgi:flagellin-like protein